MELIVVDVADMLAAWAAEQGERLIGGAYSGKLMTSTPSVVAAGHSTMSALVTG